MPRPLPCHLQIGRYPRDQKWNVGGRKGIFGQWLDFAKQAIAITGEGSRLAQTRHREWLVGFLPDVGLGGRKNKRNRCRRIVARRSSGHRRDQLLEGARQMDEITRQDNFKINPAAMLALSWHCLTDGKGSRDMVILPYKDRLELFAKYLQQLVMESLGKEKDLQGNVVHQGIAVYGNKGSTDQHAYVQQLREGVPNFFATFIEVLSIGIRSPKWMKME